MQKLLLVHDTLVKLASTNVGDDHVVAPAVAGEAMLNVKPATSNKNGVDIAMNRRIR
jgi:hypothetical protein